MEKKIFTIIILLAFIAKVSAQIEVHSSNQVGIGTTNPQYKLHVVGDAFVTGNLYLGNTSTILNANSILSGFSGSYGNTNVSFGYEALLNPQVGFRNTAVGHRALRNNTTTGDYPYTTNGNGNTAIGFEALYSNTTGQVNTANGYHALYSNTTGKNNTAVGHLTLYSNTTGTDNTAIGYAALKYAKAGYFNVAIGYSALYALDFNNTTSNFNTAIGANANTFLSSNTVDVNYSTAIGAGTITTASNQVRIGNSSVTSIGGYAAWSNLSDGRAKKNIRQDVPGLTFINSLQPVTYNLDLDAIDELIKIEKPEINDSVAASPRSQKLIEIEKKAREAKQKQVQTGFVAQDVEKAAKSIGYDFSGVDVDEIGIYSLRYAEFVVPLVKAVQELSDKNDRLQEQNSRQQEQIEALMKRIEALEKK